MLQRRIRSAVRFAILVAAIAPTIAAAASDSDFKLTYNQPAAKWTEASPLVNGRIGTMVFGGSQEERLQINESTLWSGRPHNYTNPEAYSHLQGIRQLIFAGEVDEAEKLSESLMGQPKLLMPYQPFCDLWLHFTGHDQATEYRRELRLDDALAQMAYNGGSTSFRREVFVSYPDQIVAIRITASQPGAVTFSIGMDSPQPGTKVETTVNDTLLLSGQIQLRQNPAGSWTGSWDQPGMRSAALLKALAKCGSVRIADGRIEISGANPVTIFTSDEIRVLPALPHQWASSSLKGVRVRGGGEVDVTWKEGRFTALRLQSDHAMECRVTYGEHSTEAQVEPGKNVVLDGALRGISR